MNQQNQSKWTENWINIQSISNGMIILPNQEKVSGVKITPRNIFILEEEAQANVITALKNFYNTIDYEFWLVVADRPVDISIYLSQLQLLYQNQQNPAIRKLINQDIQKGNFFMSNNVVDTEYYILFKERNLELLQKKLRSLISGLAQAGLMARQTSNEDLRIILDNFLNGGRTTTFGTVSVA
ncbi:MAG TPA: hypothetical protein IAB56_05775 [Candidatus Scybalousia intestinigallinarum]|nr:hypothetical protein [Candidatus Scybalousia intestinigallinarum]